MNLRQLQLFVAVVEAGSFSRGAEVQPLANDLLVLAVNARHPWSRWPRISLDDLGTGPMIVRESGSGSEQAVQRALLRAGFDPDRLQIAARLGSNEAVRQALLSGFGAAFLSRRAIRQELQRGELVEVPVAGLSVERRFWLATRRQRTKSPAAQVFAALFTG